MSTKTTDGGVKFNKPSLYSGGDLKGAWEIGYKIDGIRMLRAEEPFNYGGKVYPIGTPISRSHKPLYNLSGIPETITDAEIYRTDWETSSSLVRTQLRDTGVKLTDVYSLSPIDPRLIVGTFESPSESVLESLLESALSNGYEGLVLRKGASWKKMVPREFADVTVMHMEEGTGKFVGMLGKVHTNHGSVGTGFSILERAQMWADYTCATVSYTYRNPSKRKGAPKWLTQVCFAEPENCIVGKIIEASYREMTKGMKMRFAGFEKVRWDKDTETLPWLTTK